MPCQERQIRVGQLITPFGPGSIYVDGGGTPLIVCGLDHWFKRESDGHNGSLCDDRSEFEISEPRLSALLGVDFFYRPPDLRERSRNQHNPQPIINEELRIPALRFPTWYRNTKTGELRQFALESQTIGKPEGGGRWQPVRFVAVCDAGHLCDFPWKKWIRCKCEGPGHLFLIDHGGADLGSILVRCDNCHQRRTLAGAMRRLPAGEGSNNSENAKSTFETEDISCPGERPWLGTNAIEQCSRPLVGALINQTNLYFPRIVSSIYVPDLQISQEVAYLRYIIEEEPSELAIALTRWRAGHQDRAIKNIKQSLEDRDVHTDEDQVQQALESIFNDQPIVNNASKPSKEEGLSTRFRRTEFNILREPLNDEKKAPELRISEAVVPKTLRDWIGRIRLVERLRETRVFGGFSRLQPENEWPRRSVIEDVLRQLFRNPPVNPHDRWLPAIKVYGEGLYFELSEEKIASWINTERKWLENRLHSSYLENLGSIHYTLPPLDESDWTVDWAARYLLVHSLSHILINQLIFESGYSSASLRERLFVSADRDAPMAGILVYTAAGDSEGTLGGLVRLGREDRFEPLFHRSLGRASWCSADPVCSERLDISGGYHANLAACHACILLPETSCETINRGLDRAMVVGTPEERDKGFFSSFIIEPIYIRDT